jgi:hypothetical protein
MAKSLRAQTTNEIMQITAVFVLIQQKLVFFKQNKTHIDWNVIKLILYLLTGILNSFLAKVGNNTKFMCTEKNTNNRK